MKLLPVAALFILVLLSGCTVPNQKDELSVNPNLSILSSQQQLEDHSYQLDSLASTQDEMLRQLNSVQVALAQLNQELKSQVEIPVVTEEPPAKEKIIRQTRAEPVAQGKAILGRVEYIWMEGKQVYLKARVDTGAKSSSLHATNIQRFERDGDKWVRFVVDLDSQHLQMEAPLERLVKIRQVNTDEMERRPVVKLEIKLGEIKEETEFTLTDRSDMVYPILLGRSFLQDIALVDVARKFTRKRDPKLKALAEAK